MWFIQLFFILVAQFLCYISSVVLKNFSLWYTLYILHQREIIIFNNLLIIDKIVLKLYNKLKKKIGCVLNNNFILVNSMN